jgi:hypothetical protein
MDNHEEEFGPMFNLLQGAQSFACSQPAIRIVTEAGEVCKTLEFATKEDYEHYKKLND